jgi:hypothetical protein
VVGSLTSLHAIDGERFDEMKRKRLLRRLARVCAGVMEPGRISFRAGHVFPSVGLDRAWAGIGALFERIDPVDGKHFARHHGYYSRPIGWMDSAYWEPIGVLHTLGSFARLCRAATKELGAAPQPRCTELAGRWRGAWAASEVVAPDGLEPAFTLLEAFFRGRLARSGPWATGDRGAIDGDNLGYWLGHYRGQIAFMTEALWPATGAAQPRDTAVVRVSV